jgi:hypothetical protein
MNAIGNPDGFVIVNSPISALRFNSLSLQRTASTPHSTRFARLELGLFTKPSMSDDFLQVNQYSGHQNKICRAAWMVRGSPAFRSETRVS